MTRARAQARRPARAARAAARRARVRTRPPRTPARAAALHGTEQAALGETHSSGDDGDTPAAAALREAIAANCLAPTGLMSLHATLAPGRRIDPFMLLSCLVGEKPGLQAPADQALHAWSDEHTASSFEVDVGQAAP